MLLIYRKRQKKVINLNKASLHFEEQMGTNIYRMQFCKCVLIDLPFIVQDETSGGHISRSQMAVFQIITCLSLDVSPGHHGDAVTGHACPDHILLPVLLPALCR